MSALGQKPAVLASQSDVSLVRTADMVRPIGKRRSACTTQPQIRTHPLILPDGQISSCFPKWSVQPLLQKYFVWRLTQITSLIRPVLSHRGAFRDRHGRWERDAGDAAALSVGRDAGQADKAC